MLLCMCDNGHILLCCLLHVKTCWGIYAVSNNSWMGDVIRIGHLTTTEEVETM